MKKAFIKTLLLLPMILNGCGVGDLENQVAHLTSSQSLLTGEKDSLVKLLSLKSDTMKARNLAYVNLTSDKSELEAKTKALQALLNARTRQLGSVQASQEKMEWNVARESAKNDSLMKEITILNRKIAEIDTKISQEKKENVALSASLRQESEKRKADSIKFANAPEPQVFRKSFVHIVELGAGLGLGDTKTDYSARFISPGYVLGYNVSENFMIGAGTGINFYNGGIMIPLYLDVRYHLSNKMYSPYIAGDGGMLFNTGKFSEIGMFVNPQFGISRRLNDKMKLNLSTGLLIQLAPAGIKNSFVNIKGGFSFGK